MMRRQQQQQQRRQHQDQQSRVFYELSALVLSLLRSPPSPPPFAEQSSPDLVSSPPPTAVRRPPPPSSLAHITPAGFASLMLGISLALMLCGSVTFFIGFMLMPWVLGLVMVFYVAGIVSTISILGKTIFCYAMATPSSPKKEIPAYHVDCGVTSLDESGSSELEPSLKRAQLKVLNLFDTEAIVITYTV